MSRDFAFKMAFAVNKTNSEVIRKNTTIKKGLFVLCKIIINIDKKFN